MSIFSARQHIAYMLSALYAIVRPSVCPPQVMLILVLKESLRTNFKICHCPCQCPVLEQSMMSHLKLKVLSCWHVN